MDLFFHFCEKLSDSVKFGQDFLSLESMPVWYRHQGYFKLHQRCSPQHRGGYHSSIEGKIGAPQGGKKEEK